VSGKRSCLSSVREKTKSRPPSSGCVHPNVFALGGHSVLGPEGEASDRIGSNIQNSVLRSRLLFHYVRPSNCCTNLGEARNFERSVDAHSCKIRVSFGYGKCTSCRTGMYIPVVVKVDRFSSQNATTCHPADPILDFAFRRSGLASPLSRPIRGLALFYLLVSSYRSTTYPAIFRYHESFAQPFVAVGVVPGFVGVGDTDHDFVHHQSLVGRYQQDEIVHDRFGCRCRASTRWRRWNGFHSQ